MKVSQIIYQFRQNHEKESVLKVFYFVSCEKVQITDRKEKSFYLAFTGRFYGRKGRKSSSGLKKKISLVLDLEVTHNFNPVAEVIK